MPRTRKQITELFEFANELADTARALVLDDWDKKLQVATKPDHSLVSELDYKVELHCRELISERFPSHGIIGEEFGDHNLTSDWRWIIDPIDGTQEFVNKLPFFGIIIALHYRDKPLVGIIDHPIINLRCAGAYQLGTFINENRIRLENTDSTTKAVVIPARADFRKYAKEDALFVLITKHYNNHRIFRNCYGHTSTIMGGTKLTIEHDVRLWDIAASRVLIEEAGGKYAMLRRLDLAPDEQAYSVAFGVSSVVDQVVHLLQPLYVESIE
jgi:fructose-1,6-bisphosphatase/inositol monophosphatase family enzyme